MNKLADELLARQMPHESEEFRRGWYAGCKDTLRHKSPGRFVVQIVFGMGVFFGCIVAGLFGWLA